MRLEIATLRRLRERAHVHTARCQADYRLDGAQTLICGRRADADLAELLAEYDRLVATSAAAARVLSDADKETFADGILSPSGGE